VPRFAVIDHQIEAVGGRFAIAGLACHCRASLSAQGGADKGRL
jgi:hypothetical protein